MKFFRPGYIQKALILLVLILQVLLMFGLFVWLEELGISSKTNDLDLYFVLIIFIVDMVLASLIVNNKAPYVYKITWMFVVFLIPVGGAILYLVFANKTSTAKRMKKHRRFYKPLQKNPATEEDFQKLEAEHPNFAGISNYLVGASGEGASGRTSIQYFPLGDDAFEPMLNELRKAKHYIFLEYFIVDRGTFWDSILDVLKEKAAEGLDVRVMYDDLGCLTTLPRNYPSTLEAMGIKCHAVNRIRPLMDVRMNNRDHRKMLIIDGHTAFSGGYNLADEYINTIDRFGHWKDNGILLRGKAVYGFTSMFLSTWNSMFDQDADPDRSYYLPERFIDEIGGFPETDGLIQPYGDLPFDAEAVGERVYLNLLHNAKKTCYITTPYLIIDEEMVHALSQAAKEGVDVRMILPGIPDKKAPFCIARSFYGPLLKAGVRIYEYTPGFVHAKTFVVDDKVATVGTINLDYRSLFLHMECGTLILGSECVHDIQKDLIETMEKCQEVTFERFEKWHRRNQAYWALLRIAAPFL